MAFCPLAEISCIKVMSSYYMKLRCDWRPSPFPVCVFITTVYLFSKSYELYVQSWQLTREICHVGRIHVAGI